MRRLTLLLCLLMVAALHWIIGPDEALTDTGQNEAVVPTPDLTLEAVNTGFKGSLVEVGIVAEDAVWTIQESLWATIDAGAHSTKRDPRPIESARGVQIHRDRRRQDDRKSPSNPGSGTMALDKSACNLA